MSEYIGVGIGGAIGISGSIVIELIRWRKEDKQRLKELEQKRLDDAHTYFRGLYDAVKPFLKAYTLLSFKLRVMGLLEIGKEFHPDVILSDNATKLKLEAILNELISGTKVFIDEGYASLFPERLFNEIIMLDVFLAGYMPSLEGKSLFEMNDKEAEGLKNIYIHSTNIKNMIRHALNVDALIF